LRGLREGWQGQALHKKALPKLRPNLETAMVPVAELFMSDAASLTLPRLAQEAPKNVLREELGRTKIE